MNEFDENNEFVKRPSAFPENGAAPIRKPTESTQSRTYSGLRTPHTRPARPAGAVRQSNTSQNPKIGEVRRPSGAPQVNGAAQRPSQPKRTAYSAPIMQPKKVKNTVDKKIFARNIVFFFILLALFLFLGFVAVLSSLKTTPEKNNTNYIVVYKIGETKKELASLNVNKVAYMNITALSEACGFTVSGTKASLRFTADKGEYAEFTIGSTSAHVNGDIVNMEGAALVRGEDVYIPIAFAENIFGGLVFETDEENGVLTVSREVTSVNADGSEIYADITFRIKGSVAIPGIDEDPSIGKIVAPTFKNDLSEYEQYMNPEDRDAYLILVNKTNTIDSESIPDLLVPIENTRKDRAKEQMVECAEKALEAMFLELYSAGYTDVSVTSGYRSYSKQVSLFNTYLQQEMSKNPSLSEAEAKEIVLTYSAFPGTSEHQTGLCCDMHNLSSADVSFANKPAYTWLIENCYNFGFILRFPEDKTEITGYSFEPWHYRFVGRYHATRMHELGMCLEEYTEYLARIKDN